MGRPPRARVPGSDLKELCRNAPVRELVRQAKGDVELLARTQDEVCTRDPFR